MNYLTLCCTQDPPRNIAAYVCDVTDQTAVDAAIDSVMADFEQIDVLVNCRRRFRDSLALWFL